MGIPGSKMIQNSLLNVCSNPENFVLSSGYRPKIDTRPTPKANMVMQYNPTTVAMSQKTLSIIEENCNNEIF